MRIVCILFQNKTEIEKIATACFRFSPRISIAPNAVLIDIEGCQKLYSESSLSKRIQFLLGRFQTLGRIAFGNDIPTSIAMAFFGLNNHDELPIEALRFYCDPYDSNRSLEPVIETFKRLGVLNFAQLNVVPKSALASRFGKEALYAVQRISAATDILWKQFKPPESVFESSDIDSDHSVTELEPILFLLRSMIDRALLRLHGQGKLASVVQVTLECEKYSTIVNPTRSWEIELSFPQGSVVSLLPILKERMDSTLQREPLRSPVIKVVFEVPKSVDGHSKQKDFFSKKEEEEEHFKAIITRLTDKLGIDKVFHAAPLESYFPERAWKKTLDKPSSCNTSIPERPLRVLKNPAKIRRIEDYFIHRKRRWKIQNIHGPERLSGDWWLQDHERDYFRVQTEQGEELWIFQLTETREYFLHGIYD